MPISVFMIPDRGNRPGGNAEEFQKIFLGLKIFLRPKFCFGDKIFLEPLLAPIRQSRKNGKIDSRIVFRADSCCEKIII